MDRFFYNAKEDVSEMQFEGAQRNTCSWNQVNLKNKPDQPALICFIQLIQVWLIPEIQVTKWKCLPMNIKCKEAGRCAFLKLQLKEVTGNMVSGHICTRMEVNKCDMDEIFYIPKAHTLETFMASIKRRYGEVNTWFRLFNPFCSLWHFVVSIAQHYITSAAIWLGQMGS